MILGPLRMMSWFLCWGGAVRSVMTRQIGAIGRSHKMAVQGRIVHRNAHQLTVSGGVNRRERTISPRVAAAAAAG